MRRMSRLWCAFALAMTLGLATSVRAELVGLWRFDADGATQPDLSGKGGTAIPTNEAKWVNDAERGGVFEFDGQQDYLEIEDSDPLSIEGSITIVAWAKFNTFDTWNGIVGKTGLDNNNNRPAPYDLYTMQGGEGWVQAYFGNGAAEIDSVRSDLPPELEAWQHVAMTMNVDDLSVTHYLNGEINGEGVVDFPPVDLDTNLYIGSRADFVTNMDGRLDDVAIFNEALSAAQIQKVMAGDFSEWLKVGIPGDYNGNGSLDLADLDLISTATRGPNGDIKYDVNKDNKVNFDDRQAWVTTLRKTWIGDSNLDGEFNSSDFVQVFAVGEYEDGVAANSGWGDGDWNNDGEFDSGDFVEAFQGGGFEKGPVAAVSAVPEPSSLVLLAVGSLLLARGTRRR